MAELDDVGTRALSKVRQLMGAEPSWSVSDGRSFTWWGKDFAQRISVTEPFESAGFRLCKLTAVTPVLERVPVGVQTYEVLSALNAYGCTLSSLVLDKDGVVSYVASAVVHEQTLAEVPGLFAVVAAMQAADAQHKAETLADGLKGQPVRRRHPVSGARPDFDHALYVTERLVAPHGAEPCPWVGDDMLNTLSVLKRTSMMANGDADGLVAEFPYGRFSSLLKFDTGGKHPQVGHGLHVTLRIPENPATYPLPVTVGFLNELEAGVGELRDFQGTWCVGPDDTLTFTAFYPNAFFKRGRGQNIALSMAARADWIASQKDPTTTREERRAAGRPSVAYLAESAAHAPQPAGPKTCPNCGLYNPGSAQECDCGYDFQTRTLGGRPLPATAGARKASWLSRLADFGKRKN